ANPATANRTRTAGAYLVEGINFFSSWYRVETTLPPFYNRLN
ncbi:MAG: hypothetical protein ACI9BW_002459, partial [Gammaproteobacteria bacterium]